MRRVCAATAASTTSGAEQCEYSSRKWCSTAQTQSKPSASARRACSRASRKTLDSTPASNGRGTDISKKSPKRMAGTASATSRSPWPLTFYLKDFALVLGEARVHLEGAAARGIGIGQRRGARAPVQRIEQCAEGLEPAAGLREERARVELIAAQAHRAQRRVRDLRPVEQQVDEDHRLGRDALDRRDGDAVDAREVELRAV